MADKTDGAKGQAVTKGPAQGLQIESAVVAPDGTITVPCCEAKLTSVDVADVDLLLGFADGTFVVIPNGALDALSDSPHSVLFLDKEDTDFDAAHFGSDHTSTLGDLFKMVGITNIAESGSLRVVSQKVDAPRGEEAEPVTENEVTPSDTIDPPQPEVQVSSGIDGKGPGTGAIDPTRQLIEPIEADPVVPVIPPRPSVYRPGQKVYNTEPTIRLDSDVTPDDIVNIAESAPSNMIGITGSVGGTATVGDTVTVTVDGIGYTGVVAVDMTFSVDVPGDRFVTDGDKTVEASITSGSKTATDFDQYSVDLSSPVPTITLDAEVSGDGFINLVESNGNVAVTGTVGGDAQTGDTVTVTVNGQAHTGQVQPGGTFSVTVPGSDLDYAGDGNVGTITATIDTVDAAGNPGSAADTGNYTIDLTPPSPTIALDPDITGPDDTVDFVEVQGPVTITGIVAGDAQVNDWVTLTVGGNTYKGQVFFDTIDGRLEFSIDVDGSALEADADRTIDAIVESYDAAGNYGVGEDIAGGIGGGESYSLDTSVPVPTIEIDPDITPDDTINVSESLGTVTITGSVGGDAQIGDEVTLTIGGIDYVGYVFDDVANSRLGFSIPVAGSSLVADADRTIDAIVTTGGIGSVAGTGEDVAGGPGGGESYSIAITPPAPQISLDTPIAGDDIINIAESGSLIPIQGSITGDAQVGDTVTLTMSSANFTGTYTGTVFDDGVNGLRFSIDVAGGALIADEDLTVEASVSTTDVYGNVGSDNDFRTFTFDLLAPGKPIVTGVSDDTAGTSAVDGITSDQTLIFSGTAEANSRVEVFIDGASIGFATADGSGSWSFDHTGATLGEGTYAVTATATDAAGNTSLASAPYNVTIDISVPTPTVALATDTGDNTNGNLLVMGTEPGATVEFSLDGATGWTTVQPPFAVGGNNIYVRQTDAAGNISASTFFTFTYGDGTGESLIGDAGDNILAGAGGNDDIQGQDGNDTLYGDSGDDTLDGGIGSDILFGGDGNDTLTGGAGADVLDGGVGADTASYASAGAGVDAAIGTGGTAGEATGDTYIEIENLTGSAYADTLIGDGNDNVLIGGGDDDVLTGGGGADKLYGDAGNDTLTGGAGADEFYGGADNDTASYAGSSVAVDASLSTGLGFGGDAEGDTYIDIENLTGGNGDDILTGDGNVNILTGGAGNDLLTGGAGADKLYGDAGNDTVSYASSAIAVNASLASGTGLGGNAAGDEYFDIENLIGGDGDDTLTGDASDNVLTGGIGADSLVGGLGTDTASYFNAGSSVEASLANAASNTGEAFGDTYTDIENLTGSGFDDILTGNAAANILFGGVGNDILEGLAGGDVLDGGLGINTASYATAGAGVTASLANAGSNIGDAAGDTYINIHNLIGSAYADILTGDGNDNILTGGAGGDTLTGGAGSDTVSYANASGDVWASLSSAFIRFGDAVGDSFNGIENLTGSDYNDYLAGDSGNNILTGGLGDDTLEGQAGDDTIFAHQGHDTVLGDIGDDTIHVSADSAHLPTSISGGEGSEDSAYGDVLVLHDLGGTYDLTNLANVASDIETLDISDGGNATALTISSQDIQSMVGDGNVSELTILADSGDTLVLDLVGAETSSSAVDAGHTDYTITDGSQIALIHWVIA